MESYIKALVVSDTHCNRTSLKDIIASYSDVDYIFHLGDNTIDTNYLVDNLPDVKIVGVKGNCDFGNDYKEFEELTLMGNKIILTHGHLLNVKYSYDKALLYAKEHEAKALLFGHTHKVYTEYEDGVWLINPGCAGKYEYGDMSVAMLVISEAGVVPKILKLGKAEIF